MAQIPGLPTNEPVFKPSAKPALFGIGAEAVAGLGQESEQLAQGASEVQGYLARANRQLKAKEAQISFDRTLEQVHVDLSKATTPEQVDSIYNHAQSQLNNSLAPYEQHDHVLARELGIYRQQQDVELQHVVNAKKADIITKSDQAANIVLGEKSLQQAVTTKMGGGDAGIVRMQFAAVLDQSVQHGTLTPEQAEAHMQKWDMDYQKGVILAKINSPSASVRQDVIKQLSDGGGTLEHSSLNSEVIGQLYTHAVDTDHNLTLKEEAGRLNDGLNTIHNAFQSQEYKTPDGSPDFEAMFKALDNSQFLLDNNIKTPDGKPNFVLAGKLAEDVNRQREYHDRVQREHDETALQEYSPMVDGHELSLPQIAQLQESGKVSSRAASVLRSQWYRSQAEARAEYRFAKSEARADRAEKHQEQASNAADYYTAMQSREAIDPIEVWNQVGSGNLTFGQAKGIVNAYKHVQNVDFKNNLSKITSAPGLSKAQMSELSNELTTAVNQQNLQGKAMDDFTDNLLKEHGKKQTDSLIRKMWNNVGILPLYLNPATLPIAVTAGALSGLKGGSMPTSTKPQPPKGATGTAPSRIDGKLHYTNKNGDDLGVAE